MAYICARMTRWFALLCRLEWLCLVTLSKIENCFTWLFRFLFMRDSWFARYFCAVIFFNCNLPCIGYFMSLRVSVDIYIIVPSILGISRRVFGQTLKLPILIELHVYQLLGINVFGGDQILPSRVLLCDTCSFSSMLSCSFVNTKPGAISIKRVNISAYLSILVCFWEGSICITCPATSSHRFIVSRKAVKESWVISLTSNPGFVHDKQLKRTYRVKWMKEESSTDTSISMNLPW